MVEPNISLTLLIPDRSDHRSDYIIKNILMKYQDKLHMSSLPFDRHDYFKEICSTQYNLEYSSSTYR